MPHATAVAAIMKALPSALGRTMLVHHHPTPSLICSSCSELFSSRNANLSSCWLSSSSGGAKGKQQSLQAAERLGFYRSTTSIRRLEDGGGDGSSTNRFSKGRDNFRSSEIMCMQQQNGGGHGSLGWQQQQAGRENVNLGGARRLWISTPLQMGRRSAKIATKKGAQDKKKAKLYGRIGKQIVAAVKGGGPNPVSNVSLAALLQTAKDYNIPKDIIDRNVKKASDKNQQDFEELTYEVYGFGGVGIVLEVLTDNNNRAAANIRDVVKKSGGKMAEKGSVLFNFKRAGVIVVKSSAETTGDDILLAAMDAGAEDVLEPSEDDEDDEDGAGEKYYKVLTPLDQFWTITQKLKEAGLPVDTDNSGLELFPVATVKPDDEAEELNRVMMEKLLDLDDVDAVSSTQGSCPCQRDLATLAGGVLLIETTNISSGPRKLENLWRDFFSDPSQWWDHRSVKTSAKYPDFTHKKTKQALFLDNRRNPGWVKSELAALGPGALHLNPFSWNTKLASYVKDGQDGKTLELFQEMEQEGSIPDSFTYVQVLHSCASLQALEEGRRIHGQIIESGYEQDVFVGSGLINMYSKCGSPDEGRAVFDKIPIRNVVVWNAMIQGYGKCGQAEKALELFLSMQVERVEPDRVTFAAILNACSGMYALEEGRRVHAQIIERSLESDVRLGTSLVVMYAKCGSMEDAHRVFNRLSVHNLVTWNTMIMGYVKCGQGHTALELFRLMQEETVEPDSVTLVGALNACASVGCLKEGRRIHALIIEKDHEADVNVGNALVDMYSKCGNIQDATRVFNKMPSGNLVSCTAMLGGYAMHGNDKEALILFEQMCQQGIEMDWTTFVCLLSACSHAGLVEKGLHYFQSMSPVHGVSPRAEHYACIVHLLGRVGRLDEAEAMIKTMSCQPNVNVWRALLRACKVHGNVHVGERSVRQVLRLDSQKSPGFVMLSDIYSATSKWNSSAKVRKLKMEKGSKKQPARSWIRVNNKVHSFVVDDEGHPQISEIHAGLKILSEKMEEVGYVPDLSIEKFDVEEEEKPSLLGHYSEKLAIAFGLISTPPGTSLLVVKNLRMCGECHTATKSITEIVSREIVVRDANRFHHFKDGVCSCGDYW